MKQLKQRDDIDTFGVQKIDKIGMYFEIYARKLGSLHPSSSPRALKKTSFECLKAFNCLTKEVE